MRTLRVAGQVECAGCDVYATRIADDSREVAAGEYSGRAVPAPPPNILHWRAIKKISRSRFGNARDASGESGAGAMLVWIRWGGSLKISTRSGSGGTDAGHSIDASGVLLDGTKVSGSGTATGSDGAETQFAAVTGKLLTYSLGRGLSIDAPASGDDRGGGGRVSRRHRRWRS
jgi:hypothetical protein